MSTTTPSSRLDLTGQASEDEPSAHALHPRANQKDDQQQQRLSQSQQKNLGGLSQSQQTNTTTAQRKDTLNANGKNRKSNDGDNSDKQTNKRTLSTSNARSGGEMLTRYIPNPIDLWHNRTLPSLLALPFVFMMYIILQVPLHYGSSTDRNTWAGRAQDVDKLSEDLTVVEHDLTEVKEEHLEIKAEVSDLRRRLNKMKDRRKEREETGKVRRETERRREEEEIKEQWRKQLERQEEERKRLEEKGQEVNGPIASVTMVKAMAVATFAGGKQAALDVDDVKKGD
mmetsp:Transcript_26648/g.48312  ORF Transcript_26648/g.48312 Transcript_26648/m.48312 type:complete len:284 (+) Transcript_26648:108-959(+)|eukprot:CAMPEP_0196134048 /NCGR_PEP_ID=MMETSP0910-20130528/3036_1 /TAXON_ID=49265 /ORGANISM="Thalassiosira rotula, Strain GSO102" /LENGTH=283 /DNA_ID=CAMNT_0041393845 /DNA_START=81 /DNA_END=932 /DNA_ORIENTATION=+